MRPLGILGFPRIAPMPIRVLPRQLVDQIAAGEVVERPASAVKELVENALDAGARRIEVVIEGGGADRLSVSDDGSGIPPEELPLAVASHATSKIERAEDLERISTMGFRGEALASIAAVSRLEITSRTEDATMAWRMTVEGGQAEPARPAAAARGTTVEVRQLFFNVPARRRFLRSAATETGRVQEIVEAIAIGRPGTAFRLEVDGRVRLDLPATHEPRERALAVLGESAAGAMLEVTAEAPTDGGGVLTLWGLAGTPAVARGSGRALRLALNGRAVHDRTLLHAVKEAYRGLLDPGRTPLAYLALEMDPALVDVNVHPSKTEVRFRHSSQVHQFVQRAVRDALRAADLVPAFALGEHGHARVRVGEVHVMAPDASVRGPLAVPESHRGAAEAPALLVEVAPPRADPELLDARRTRRVLQVHGSYLVVEDAEGVLIVDQHALHERAMFEELSARVASGALESQSMLVPTIVPVDARTVEAIDALQPLLARIGVEALPAGPRSIAIHAFPTFLLGRRVDPGVFMSELLERAADDGLPRTLEEALHAVLDMMACKAAVKAGDHLTGPELAALLDLRDRIERGTACPHGRPTTLRISIRDLERQFGRA